jgi:hypothetical protein
MGASGIAHQQEVLKRGFNSSKPKIHQVVQCEWVCVVVGVYQCLCMCVGVCTCGKHNTVYKCLLEIDFWGSMN